MPADPVPLTGRVSAFEVAKTWRRRSFVLVEERQELRIEVPEHGPGQRHGDFRVRIRRSRPHEEAVGYPHRRIVTGPRSPAPTRPMAHGPSGRLPAWNGCSSPPGRYRPSLPTSRQDPGPYAAWVARPRGAAATREQRRRPGDRICAWSCPSPTSTRRPVRRTLQSLRRQTSRRWSLTVVADRGPRCPRSGRSCVRTRRSATVGGSGSWVPRRAARPRDLLETGIEASRGSPRALIFPGDAWAPDAVALLSAALGPDGRGLRRRGRGSGRWHLRRATVEARLLARIPPLHAPTSAAPSPSAPRWRTASRGSWRSGTAALEHECALAAHRVGGRR